MLFPLSKSATTTALDISELMLLVSGVVLVVGIVGEYAKADKWKPWLRTFEVMVMLSIAGELIADGGIFLFSKRLQSIGDSELSDLSKQLVQSNKDLTRAEKDVKDAIKQAGEAVATAGKANESASANKREAASLRKEAEGLRQSNLLLQAEVLKLRERMADRHLTPKQQSVVANKLCPKFGGLNVNITLYSADGEMNALAADIDGALPLLCPNNRIGWAVSISPVQTTEGFSGLRIFVYEEASVRVRLFASALSEALKSEGIQAEGPMPKPPLRGAMIGGGGKGRTFNAGIPGTEAGTFVEIGIGRKP